MLCNHGRDHFFPISISTKDIICNMWYKFKKSSKSKLSPMYHWMILNIYYVILYLYNVSGDWCCSWPDFHFSEYLIRLIICALYFISRFVILFFSFLFFYTDRLRHRVGNDADVDFHRPLVRHLSSSKVQIYHQPCQNSHYYHMDLGTRLR